MFYNHSFDSLFVFDSVRCTMAPVTFDNSPRSPERRSSTYRSHDHGSPEPIAVVGFSIKFPGEATSAEGFWNMLKNGRNAMTEFPKDRINLDGHYHPDTSRLDEVRPQTMRAMEIWEEYSIGQSS